MNLGKGHAHARTRQIDRKVARRRTISLRYTMVSLRGGQLIDSIRFRLTSAIVVVCD
jgi:hypothetical protein